MKKPVKKNAKKKNSLSGALLGGNAFGNLANPFSQQITQPDTVQINLRYYFISNLRQFLSQAYCEIGLLQTIVDIPVDDGLRGGIDIKSKQLDEDEIQELQADLDRENILKIVGQANKWNRLFGGAGIIILSEQDPESPFDIDLINEESKLAFRAVDMWELFWDKQNVEGFDMETQEHDDEHYNYYAEQVHTSRVMKLKGREAPSFLRPRLRGWGLSEAEALIRSINQYLKATDVGFEVLDEFKIDVFRLKNLTNTLQSPAGEAKVRQRLQVTNQAKNYQNAIVLDSEDEYSQKQLTWTGLGEAMEQIRLQVAADMRMPLTKLFGQSAAGFNSGEDDIEVYNAMIEGQVREKCKYHVLRILEIMCKKKFGMVPDDLEIEFKPLRILSAEQEENVKTQKFQRLIQAKQEGLLTTLEFREALNRDNLLGVQLDTSIVDLNPTDPDAAEVLDDENDSDKKDEQEKKVARKPKPKQPGKKK